MPFAETRGRVWNILLLNRNGSQLNQSRKHFILCIQWMRNDLNELLIKNQSLFFIWILFNPIREAAKHVCPSIADMFVLNTGMYLAFVTNIVI